MDILFASTELSPFVKVGGLADVTAALPKALRALGHRVTVVVPRFPAFEAGGLLVARRLTPVRFSLGTRAVDATVFDGRLASQVDLVLVDVPAPTDSHEVAPRGYPRGLFDREGVYGEKGVDYTDNHVRFSVFSRAVAELVKQRADAGTPFDILHLNDWPCALAATYLSEMRVADTSGSLRTRVVLTLHNVAHQGVFPKESLPDLGLSWDRFNVNGIEFFGKVNVLKQGILDADAVATVSPTYAREIQTEAGGGGLEGVFRARGAALAGIVNGVDYSVWNPATDSAIGARFDAEDASNKTRCRGALLRELGLSIDRSGPVIASVSRLVPQKGVDLLLAALPECLRATDATFVIAGDGEDAFCKQIEAAAAASHGRVVFVRAAAEPLVHRIFAGSDFVVVPSRYEPCGLVQLYAQRYGAAPIAHATGGLVDTVVDADAKLETGTGFLFEEATAEALTSAILRAVAARSLSSWPKLVRRIMRLDLGWERPARRYEQLYRSLTDAR
ncbi:MAG: glycogen/starch synthase [Polyangiaceae bacterium]